MRISFFSFHRLHFKIYFSTLSMAQIRRQTRNPSPPPRQMPLLPDAIRFQPPPVRQVQRSQSLQVNDLPPVQWLTNSNNSSTFPISTSNRCIL